MADPIKPGERLNITIEGARARLVRSEDGSGVDWLSYDVGGYVTSLPLIDQVTVERVAPAEWPPREDDLWRDHVGVVWFAVANSAGDVSLMNSRTLGLPPKQVARDFGPLTLVHREDEQDGGDRG